MPDYPFPVSSRYTAVAIAYKNKSLIGDMVLPLTPVMDQSFDWLLHNKEEGFTVPDTRVGRRGSVNQVSFGATMQTSSTEDYGLEDAIPQKDIEAAQSGDVPGMDPVGKSTEYVTNLIDLDREIRVANLVFNANTYPAANKVTLSGTSQFSDYTNSNPVSVLMGYLDIPLMRPNLAVMGQDAWRVIRQHPKVVEAVKGTGAGVNAQGMISRQQFAELLEIEELLVGEGWVNTAKRGLSASYSRVWGKHISVMYRDRLAGPQLGTTFGMNAQWGTKVAGQITDPNIGLRGGVKIRVGMSCKEIITAPDLGYFIQNAVA